ncbi:MAG: hypothetical protein H0W34_05225 [Pyrinomonadaceae bacterium]|nr:hypothetical protein [Pyrinomonadaceae bacterium]
MSEEELRALYTVAYRIITKERAIRDRAFAADTEKRQEKIAEMDKLLEVVDDMKNFCKLHVGGSLEQSLLLDMSKKVEYR